MTVTLIILLGSDNDNTGRLSDDALNRAKKVIELLNMDASALVLPTGGYSPYFNKSIFAHGYLLSQYLQGHSISKNRILKHTMTAGTIEDAFACFNKISELNPERILIVTSHHHLQRVEFIFRRVLIGYDLSILSVPCETKSLTEKTKESIKLKKAMSDWIDLPLQNKERLREIYSAAQSEHKHYDNISLVSASAVFAVFSLALTADYNRIHFPRNLCLGFTGLIVICLLLIYDRSAQTARIARRVQRYVEYAFDAPGFSVAYYRNLPLFITPSIRFIVLLLGTIMVFILFYASLGSF